MVGALFISHPLCYSFTVGMTKLTKTEVEHIAELGRLHLTEEEKERFAEQLSSILEYVNTLQKIPTEGVESMARVSEIQNVLREDEVKGCPPDARQILLTDMPARSGDLLEVPAVFEPAPKEF